jgi:hypothetical protein
MRANSMLARMTDRVRRGHGHRRRGRSALALGVLCSATASGAVAAQPVPQDDDPAQALAERFAPVIVVKQQEMPCDEEGEPFYPVPVEIVLDNPEVVLRQLGRENPTVTRAPSAADLHDLGAGFFLDFPGSSLEPGCIYEQDFDKYAAAYPPTVYAHIVQQPDEPDLLFVQYWTYWYYNDWNNKHESDWEGVTLKFEASSIEDALRSEPVAIGYSQHSGGERADWDDTKLTKDGDHPVVYASARSHASYFGSELYLGRAASEGFGCDDTTGPSERLSPDVIVVPDTVEDPNDPLAWITYRGRWGERQGGSFDGPTGPAAKDRWLQPAPWFEDLRNSSVVIPAGDSGVAEVIDVFCGVVELGSTAFITFTVSPVRLLVASLLLALLVRFLVRRTDWTPVGPEPLVRRRRAGQIMRAAFAAYRRTPGPYLLFGVIYIPAAIVTGLLATLVQLVPFVASLQSLAGERSGVNIVLAALVGSVANVAAFVVINAMVAEYLEGDRRGLAAAADAARATWDRRRPLGAAFVRSFVIVFVLLASVIGIPWGVRQLVRYQFLAQAVMHDDRSGQAALDRSSRLVRGRWLHTALVAAVLNGTVALTALGVAVVLLVVASGLPLWIFAALAALVYGLTVPLAAIAMALLYGDAIAEHEGRVATDELEPAR